MDNKIVEFQEAQEWMERGNKAVSLYSLKTYEIESDGYDSNCVHTGFYEGDKLSYGSIKGKWELIPRELTKGELEFIRDFISDIMVKAKSELNSNQYDYFEGFIKDTLNEKGIEHDL